MKKKFKFKPPTVIDYMSIAFTLGGYAILWVQTNWKVCVAVLLITIGNNLDEKSKRDGVTRIN